MTIFYSIGTMYPAQVGGPSNVVYWLAKALSCRNIAVKIAATDKGINDLSISLNKSIKTPFGEVIYARTPILYFPIRLISLSLKPLLKSDVVHVNGLFYPASFVLATIAVIIGKPVVWSVHGELYPDALKFSPRRKKWLLSYIKCFLAKQVTFHATAQEEVKYIREHFGKKVKLIEIPVLMEVPEKLNLPKDDYILFLGRLHKIKAIDRLIEAFYNSSVCSDKNTALVIAGPDDTEYADYLKKMVKSLELEHRVHFTGHTDGQVKEALLAKAKCLILPSYTENFGIVVTEALAQGTPVIASKGTPWEVLNTYKAGFWVDNSSDELCKALNKMLSLSSDQYDQYVNNSIRLVDEMYNVDKQIHKWIDLYQQLSENEG